MTLKLPKERTAQVLSAALTLLRRHTVVTGVRQLFHNRSEVTVAMRSRSARRRRTVAERFATTDLTRR